MEKIIEEWEYFLGVILGAYRDFEQRVGLLTLSKGAKHEVVSDVVERLPNQFQYIDVDRACQAC